MVKLEPRTRTLKILIPLLVVGLAILIFVTLWSTKPRLAREIPVERTWVVTAKPIQFGEERPLLSVFGEVIAGRQVDLRTLVSGSVIAIGKNFAEGARVSKGEQLIIIDPFDYRATLDERLAQHEEGKARLAETYARLESERASLSRDQEQVELIKRDTARKVELLKRGNVSQKVVDDAQLSLSRQLQSVAARETSIRIEEARVKQQLATNSRLEVGVRRARRDLDRTYLRAPFSGFLTQTTAAVGKRINTNDFVATLISSDRFEVRLHLSDEQYGRILATEGGLKGREASVVWNVGPQEIVFPAVIDRVGSLINTASAGIDLYALVEGVSNDSPLRPGAFVRVQLTDRTYRQVARVPSSALHGEQIVYVVNVGRLESRAVEVIARDGADLLLRGDLKNGDWVVSSRFASISPGLKVEIR